MVDGADFKQFEYCGWQRSVEQYHRSFGKLTTLVVAQLLEQAGPAAGTLLDIACGPGHVTEAARLFGWQARGLDFAEEMVAAAQRLYPHGEFELGDAEALGCASDHFAAAVPDSPTLFLRFRSFASASGCRRQSNSFAFQFMLWGPMARMRRRCTN